MSDHEGSVLDIDAFFFLRFVGNICNGGRSEQHHNILWKNEGFKYVNVYDFYFEEINVYVQINNFRMYKGGIHIRVPQYIAINSNGALVRKEILSINF